MTTRTAIVIPARYGSTRFPGKPLANIAGQTMLERVCRIALASDTGEVIVATDHPQILEHAGRIGVRAVSTPVECSNGTERIVAALEELRWDGDFVVNLQGDAVLTPPWVLEAIVKAYERDADPAMFTPACALTSSQVEELRAIKQTGEVSGTTVVFDRDCNALYFSKSVIPYCRTPLPDSPPAYRHIGLYGYRRDFLMRYISLAPGPLEKMEGLEQLRALEHGTKIRVVPVDYRGRSHASVDAPQDIARVEEIIAREGELV